MSDRANSFKLGLFTLVAVLLFLGLLAALGAGVFRSRGVLAETYTPDSVLGLEVRAPVRFRGVRVGEVSFIGFVAQKYAVSFSTGENIAGYVLIQMNLDTRTGLNMSETEATLEHALKQGLHARLASSSLMGPAYLELVMMPDASGTPPLAITWQPEGIVIPASPSVMSQITSSVETLAIHLAQIDFKSTFSKLDNLLNHADEALSGSGLNGLKQSVVDAMNSANQAATRLRSVLDNPAIDRIVSNVEEITASLNSGDGKSRDLAAFVQELPAIAKSLRDASTHVDQILTDPRTTRILDNLDKTLVSTPGAAEDIRQLVRRLSAVVAESQNNIERSLSVLRNVLDNVDAITSDAKSNPSRLLFGDPPPRTRPGEPAKTGEPK
ncbi:MAG: MCE family protein [Phycisphaeraceae bacterium]|nr:MCE family protein [Phycisphaeraceae bacterium]